MRLIANLLLCAVSLRVVSGFSHYQQQIPNGQWVPSPCEQGEVWMGVGHMNPAGGGPRNPFGRDFANNDHNWTRICHLDSDGDDLTNGEELGDPDCTWKPGTTPSRSHDLSHPGICEPRDSRNCMRRNQWLRCPRPVHCQATNQTGMMQKSLRFPATSVPRAKNTYMCLGISLPADVAVNGQLPIAVEPYIDNTVVMHHVNFWGCRDVPSVESFPKPQRCWENLELPECPTPTRLWTTGQKVRCTPTSRLRFINETHIAFKYAVLQLHWRNAERSSEHVDSSGLVMYYRDSGEPGVSTDQPRVSTHPRVSTDHPRVSAATDHPRVSADPRVSTDHPRVSADPRVSGDSGVTTTYRPLWATTALFIAAVHLITFIVVN